MKGVLLTLVSVLLTSAAQLAMGYAMTALPPVSQFYAFIGALWPVHLETTLLLAGLAGYLASMFFWYLALHHLALSKAYALLSLSYILVWSASLILPGMHGIFSVRSLIGVLVIIAGVLVIFLPAHQRHG
jgi:undecaprenyl phosphate-alpha-L-ara4N flippase subunit ArnF